MRKSFVMVCLVCLGLSISVWANGAEPDGERTPWTAKEFRLVDRPGEIVAVLANGVVAIVKENRTAPVAAVRMYVRAGSIYEQEHLGAGISHLFEHLLAGGATENRSEDESRELIEQIGARYNAMTGKASTCYFLTVPAQHVQTALNLIADWVTRPTFPEEAFTREWDVVQRELEMGATDPERVLWQTLDVLRYKVHPGRFPVIGYQAILKNTTREDILRYYRRMYIPDNTVVSVVGDINAEEMLDLVREEFSDFERRPQPSIVLPEEPTMTAPRESVVVLPSLRGPAKMIVAFPSFALQHKDLYALDTLASILGQGQSSRLYRRLREQEQLVLSVASWNYTPYWAPGTFAIVMELDPENIDKTKAAMWEEISRMARDGVTAEELARAKRQQQVDHIRANQTAEQQAATMARDYLSTGDAHFSDHYVANMQEVTAQDVQAMVAKYFLPEKQISLVVAAEPLAQADEAASAAVSEDKVKLVKLDNGLRVLIKRNPAVPLVNVQLYVMGGLLAETDENNGLSNVMTYVSTKGTANYTAEQIVDYFEGIGGTYGAACGNNTFFYKMETMPEDFDKAFEVFSEIVLQPSFPQEELVKVKQQVLASIAQMDNSWWQASSRYFRSQFFVDSPYRRTWQGSKQGVEAIERGTLETFHRENVLASRTVLAVFGDVDPTAVELAVRERFGQMPGGEPLDLSPFDHPVQADASQWLVKKTEKTGAAVFLGYPGMKLTDIDDRYAIDVVRQIIGSNTGWLHERLRDAGLVYYAWGMNFAGLVPGFFGATAQCEADKVPAVVEAMQEELGKAARGEFSEAEVSRAKSKLINAEVLDKQTNADAAMTAALDELYGFGYEWGDGNVDRIMGVTMDAVKRVAKKYLSGSAVVTVVTSEPDKAVPTP